MKNRRRKIGNKGRGVSVSLAVALSALVAIVGCAGVTFSRYFEGYMRDRDVTSVAGAVANFTHKSVFLTDSEGNRESIVLDKDSPVVTINDVEPRDVIDYYFTISDTNGATHNEVRMQVTLTVTVRLEMMMSDGTVRSVYFSGWNEYGESDGVRNGALLELYHSESNGYDRQIRPSGGVTSGVDFTGNSLFTEENAETGEITNKTGFYMEPYADGAEDYTYHVKFVLPKQADETDSYVGAKVYFDIRTDAEQSQGPQKR